MSINLESEEIEDDKIFKVQNLRNVTEDSKMFKERKRERHTDR